MQEGARGRSDRLSLLEVLRNDLARFSCLLAGVEAKVIAVCSGDPCLAGGSVKRVGVLRRGTRAIPEAPPPYRGAMTARPGRGQAYVGRFCG